jgi:hypothetical protein
MVHNQTGLPISIFGWLIIGLFQTGLAIFTLIMTSAVAAQFIGGGLKPGTNFGQLNLTGSLKTESLAEPTFSFKTTLYGKTGKSLS